jgi:hypothetical protein
MVQKGLCDMLVTGQAPGVADAAIGVKGAVGRYLARIFGEPACCGIETASLDAALDLKHGRGFERRQSGARRVIDRQLVILIAWLKLANVHGMALQDESCESPARFINAGRIAEGLAWLDFLKLQDCVAFRKSACKFVCKNVQRGAPGLTDRDDDSWPISGSD